jgi:nucleoside-diphosphate-sugar epimerase
MHFLVTGGAGFVGRYLCERLAARGDRFTILDLVPPDPKAPAPARYVRGDVRDPAAVREALAGCDAIFHLAAAHHDFGIARETYFDVNEAGAEVLCAAMDDIGLREICFYSSVAIYGDAPEPHHEDSPTAPNNYYGASKLAGEQVFRRWAARGAERRVLVIRPTITFGPRNYANMYSLIRQIVGGKFLPVGSGTNVKSLSYVENLVEATLFLWDRPGRDAFEAFNWVEKPDMTSREIAEAIYHALGRRAPGFSVPLPVALALATPFDLVIKLTGRNLPVSSMRVRKLASDQTKFEADRARAAGFAPRLTLGDGIERMVRWYLAEGRHQRPVWHIPPAMPASMGAPSDGLNAPRSTATLP